MAAIKFNKDMLLKHRFWIMVGITSCLTLLGMAYLQLYGGDDVAKAQGKLKSELGRLKQEKGDKGSKSVDGIVHDADVAKDSEMKVWSEAYHKQEKLFRWADRIESEFGFLDGKFAREIKMSAKGDEKSWPVDSETVMHGTLEELNPNWFSIKNRKKEVVKFHPMDKKTLKIISEQGKEVFWVDILEGKNSLLTITYQTGKYFNDLLTPNERKVFKDSHAEQIHEILRSVDPLDDKGNGVVQLRNWRYNKDEDFEKWLPTNRFIRLANKAWNLDGDDFSAEAWIAQENFWIQKEIYRIIRSANDDIAVFDWYDKDVKKAPQDLKGKVAQTDNVYRFKNSALELELKLDKTGSLTLTVKNLLARKQKLDLNFRVLMNDGAGFKPEVIAVSGNPLYPKAEKGDVSNKDTFTKTYPPLKDAKAAPRTGIYGVEQQLTWETAAIKRIDYISIGADTPDEISHSHRTYPLALRTLEEKPAVAAPPDPLKKLPDGVPVRPDKALIAPRGALAHGLSPDHYVDVTEQSRRLPVAIVLIVDQDHVDRILTAFNNSKFRFLETQVLLNHFPGSLQPPLVEEKKEVVGDQIFIRPERIPRRPPGEGGNPAVRGGGDSEANMELVIYGIMTLYQRYPPRGAAAPAKAP